MFELFHHWFAIATADWTIIRSITMSMWAIIIIIMIVITLILITHPVCDARGEKRMKRPNAEVPHCIAEIINETICVNTEVVVHVKIPNGNGTISWVLNESWRSGKAGAGSSMGIQLYPMLSL